MNNYNINNEEPLYLISETRLIKAIQSTFELEFKKLESFLTKKSRVLTREEAAKILNVCPNTVSEYIKTGRLVNRGVGRKILLLESDLERIKPNHFTFYKQAS